MEKIQNYEEFINENILTKTLGPLFVGLLSVLPQPTNAQYNLSNQIMVTKMTNDMMFSKDKSDKSDKEKFLESIEEAHNILEILGKKDVIVGDTRLQDCLNLLDKLYNQYKNDNIVQKDMKETIESLSFYVNKYNKNLDKDIIDVFNRLHDHKYYEKEQMLKDYTIIYQKIEDMKKTYKISIWDNFTAIEKIITVILIISSLIFIICTMPITFSQKNAWIV